MPRFHFVLPQSHDENRRSITVVVRFHPGDPQSQAVVRRAARVTVQDHSAFQLQIDKVIHSGRPNSVDQIKSSGQNCHCSIEPHQAFEI
jgi:hypothetical protein